MNAILQLGKGSNLRIQNRSANSLGIDARTIVPDQCHPFVEISLSHGDFLESGAHYSFPYTTGTVVPRFGRLVCGLEEEDPNPWFRKSVFRNSRVALVEDASCLAQ